jgi:hypothetical protein
MQSAVKIDDERICFGYKFAYRLSGNRKVAVNGHDKIRINGHEKPAQMASI